MKKTKNKIKNKVNNFLFIFLLPLFTIIATISYVVLDKHPNFNKNITENISKYLSHNKLGVPQVLAAPGEKWFIERDGTDDKLKFYYGVGNMPSSAFTIASDGKVGIGTTNPQTKLNVNLGAGDSTVGTAALRIGGTNNYQSLELGIKGAYDGMISTYGNDLHMYAGNWRTAGATASENHNIYFYTSQASSTNWNTAKMMLRYDGNVGIGTTNPSHALSVVGSAGLSGKGILLATNDEAIWGTNTSGTAYRMMMYGADDNLYLVANPGSLTIRTGGDSSTNNRMKINNNGFVGIGTRAASSPRTALDVDSGTNLTDNIVVDNPGSSYGSIGLTSPGGNPGIIIYSNNGTTLFDASNLSTNNKRANIMRSTTALELGAGDNQNPPASSLFVKNDGTVTVSNSIGGGETTTGWTLGKGAWGPDAWLRLTTTAGGSTYHNLAVGPFWANGATRFDLSEVTPVKETDQLEQGDIVIIDQTKGTRVTRSNKPYDPTVYGIVSSYKQASMVIGGDVDPGRSANVKDRTPIALIGRVKAKVSAENGPIKIGDLLTTSSTPGHAMRCDDPSKCFGAIVGKALEPLSSGLGKILVLATLQ